MEYECLQCGCEIEKRHKVKRPLCSKDCRDEWNRKRRTKHCQICGDAFVSDHAKAKFCSLQCVAKHNEIGNATCCQCGVDIGRPVKNNAKKSHCGTYCQRLSQLKSKTCKLCPHCYGKPRVGCCEATTPERVKLQQDPWSVLIMVQRSRIKARALYQEAKQDEWDWKCKSVHSGLRRRRKPRSRRTIRDRVVEWSKCIQVAMQKSKTKLQRLERIATDEWYLKCETGSRNLRGKAHAARHSGNTPTIATTDRRARIQMRFDWSTTYA